MSQTIGWIEQWWSERYSVSFHASVTIKMQLSSYSAAHFSEFLWALIILRRVSWFLILFASYWKKDKVNNRSAIIVKQISQI